VLGEGAAVECAVRWLRDDKVGLEFAHETQIDCDSSTRDALLRDVIRNSFPDVEIKARPPRVDPPGDHQREAPRHPLVWTGVLHHNFEWQEARLRNISANGALVECATSVPSGANVFLDLSGAGRIAAQVSWSRGDQVGLVFADRFDVSRLSQATPLLASKTGAKAQPAPDGHECDQAPWDPHWRRLSIDELGAELGG
jgi:hypothetical protein